MNKLKELVINSKGLISITTDLFYQQREKEGLRNLEELITILAELVSEIISLKSKGMDIELDENQLLNIITDALNALEKKDTILLSDILQYELKELLDYL